MLQIVTSGKELNMQQLLPVYVLSNLECGQKLLKNESYWEQLRTGETVFRDSILSFLRIDGSMLALWNIRDRCVAALRLEPYQDGLLLSCLETAPEARGRGAATALLSAVLERCPGKVYSHIHKSNKISFNLHLKVGFEIALDHGNLLDGTTSGSYYTMIYQK